MSRISLFRILVGLLLAAAFACRSAAQAPEAPVVPPGKAVSIAVSRNMPLVGESVTVERLAPDISTCDVTDPQGGTQTLSFDAQGKASWRPAHYGLEHQTLFAIGPGFKLRPDCHGPLTEAEVKAEFAKVRRVAPESPGIAIYNAFSKEDRETIQPALDDACSQAIEDFYLKPVLHVSTSRSGKARVAELWNIGNDDASGFVVEWCDAQGKRTGESVVPALCPQERKTLPAPAGAVSLKLRAPEGIVNLYPGGVNLPR
jgi:hypothetical protein